MDILQSQKLVVEGKVLTPCRFVAAATADGECIVLCHDEEGGECYMLESQCRAVLGCGSEDVSSSTGKKLVTRRSSTAEKIELFCALFKGRSDVYAHAYLKRDGKLGYSPACANDWKRGVCPRCSNPKARCAGCEKREFRPLDSSALVRHFRGEDARYRDVLGLYVLDEECNTSVLAIDFDDGDWRQAATAFREIATAAGFPCAVERSRSGEGCHIWFFFDEPVPAKLARDMGAELLTRATAASKAVEFSSYDRMFPAQDSVPKDGFGGLIAFPLQGAAMHEGNSAFVDEEFCPYPDQWVFLSGIERIPKAAVQGIVDSCGSDGLGELANEKEPALSSIKGSTKGPSALCSRDFTSPFEVVDAGSLYVPDAVLSAAARNKVRRLAAFANPGFYRAQAMHQSVYGRSHIVDFGDCRDGYLILPRGCKPRLFSLLSEAGAEFSIVDERAQTRCIDMEFAGGLREEQERAASTLLAHEDGMLSAPTGFGKTVVAAAIIGQLRLPTLVIVPNTPLIDQWVDELGRFLVIREELEPLLTPSGKPSKRKRDKVGRIGGGKNKPSGLVDVATSQSLIEKDPDTGEPRAKALLQDYGLVICDECHHAAASQLELVLKASRARRVYGLSATPKRSDGLDAALTLLCGPIRYKGDPKVQMREQGIARLLLPRFTGVRFPKLEADSSYNQVLDAVCEQAARSELIVRDVLKAVGDGRHPLVMSKRKEHARALAAMLEREGARALLLVGEGTVRQRRERLAEALALSGADCGDALAPVLVATEGYLSEGFNVAQLDALFLATPSSFDGLVTQQAGRLHRASEGKQDVVIYDYVDASVPMLERMYKKRLKTYASLGYRVLLPSEDGVEAGRFFRAREATRLLSDDIAAARKSVVVNAPYVAAKTVEFLMPAFEAAAKRGVTVHCNAARDPGGDVAGRLREAGVEVAFGIGAAVASGLAVFDEELVWYGSLPLLAFPRSEDCSVRFRSAEVGYDLLYPGGR